MSSKKFYTSIELKKRWMKNPKFRRAYNALEPEYQIARSVIKARQDRGMTQGELAKKAGTKQPVISRLENMQGKPSYRNMERIANALGLRWDLKLVSKPR
ncbi:helix-turn-helix transcriptional regulator [bacterium]|nr:helix-turn-helix transcriptional regulator [bacterium]